VSASPVLSALCQVLREDPELAESIPPARRGHALREVIVHEVYLAPGVHHSAPTPPSGIGLLVLQGLLIRRVGIDDRFGAELLGEGDLLRPWQGQGQQMLPMNVDISVVDGVHLAVLDSEFLPHLSRYPELACALVDRATQRARHLAVNMAIVNQPRVDVRLHMLLWHLAGRWGRVRPDATVLPLRLTHAVLAQLVAARRPTVSSALSDLARRGLVVNRGDQWLLAGDAPVELRAVPPV
jgi:CRP/FNR family transcriptional regulator, cyclic AMP receptor protein